MKRTTSLLRRIVAGAVSAAILTAALPMATAAPAGVVTDTASIGGSTAKLVYVTMGNGRTADVAMAGGRIHTDTSADALIKQPTTDGNSTVVAAVNGGFFNSYYSGAGKDFPGNCPRVYATVIKDGQLVNGAGEANLLGVTWDGKPYIDRAKLGMTVLINKRVEVGVWAVGTYDSSPRAISMLTSEFPYTIKTQPGSQVFTVRDGKIASVSPAGSYSVPSGASLMIYNEQAVSDAKKWNQFPSVGDTADIVTRADSAKRADDLAAWGEMKTVIAGGRMLLQNTYDVTTDSAYNKEFDGDAKQSATGVAQRSFAAIMSDGRLVLGTVSASFKQIAAYLKGAGAVNAISLDGGASSMLYVAGNGYLTSAGRKLATAFVIVDEKTPETKPETPVVAPSEDDPATGSATGVDVNEPSSWATAQIEQGKALGLIPDWLQYTYRNNVTRREFCVLIVTLLEKKSGMEIDPFRNAKKVEMAPPFSDTDDYYVRECASFGIVTGTDGVFRPGDPISRQEAAAILTRTAKVLDAQSAGAGKSFTDAALIESWATESVAFVTGKGIMNGEGETFNPLGMFTREQAYITMLNLYNQI